MIVTKWVPRIEYNNGFIDCLYANDTECVFGIYPDCTKNIEKALMFDTLDKCEQFCLNNKDFIPFKYVIEETNNEKLC